MGRVLAATSDTGTGERPAITEVGEGYQLAWDSVGSFTLAGDGTLACTRDPREAGRWERVLVAQVLPLAAVLAGLEVLHASAVVLEGVAVGFVGPSGAGKSTLARHLIAGDARFLTDDVLALSPGADGPRAYPGASLLRTVPDGSSRTTDVSGKVAHETTEAAGPCRLGLLYFVQRAGAGTELSIQSGVDFKRLMAASFNLLVQSPRRLAGQLEVMAQVDACGAPVRVVAPEQMSAEATGQALLADARSRLGLRR